MLLLLVAACACACALLHRVVQFYRRVWRMHRLTAKMPGPPTRPLVGNFLEVAVPNEQLYDVLQGFVDRYGYLFRFWVGPVLGVFVMEPEDVQAVLTSPHLQDKPNLFYRVAEPFVGKGLLSLNGAVYRRHRKALTSSLHLEILQGFLPIFNDNARKLEARLDTLAESGDAFDSTPLLGWCASNTVCETVLASEAPDLEAERAAFVDTVQKTMELMLYCGIRPWYAIRPLFRLLDPKRYRQFFATADGLSSYAGKVLARKMAKLARGESTTSSSRRRRTFLDQFLSSDDASVMDQAELLDELKTLLLGASATSMDFLSLFMVCMALEPEVQRKIQNELDDVFGAEDSSRDILASDFPHMPYLECALKETLRYFAPVPIFGREATADVVLPSGQVLPQGSHVAISPLMVHRHPRHFPDPLKFDPDRFTPEQSRNRHPYAFIPFSAGPRNCIGQRYAMMIAKTLAATVLRRFDVLPDPEGPQTLLDVHIIAGASLSVHGGACVRVRQRAAKSEAGVGESAPSLNVANKAEERYGRWAESVALRATTEGDGSIAR